MAAITAYGSKLFFLSSQSVVLILEYFCLSESVEKIQLEKEGACSTPDLCFGN